VRKTLLPKLHGATAARRPWAPEQRRMPPQKRQKATPTYCSCSSLPLSSPPASPPQIQSPSVPPALPSSPRHRSPSLVMEAVLFPMDPATPRNPSRLLPCVLSPPVSYELMPFTCYTPVIWKGIYLIMVTEGIRAIIWLRVFWTRINLQGVDPRGTPRNGHHGIYPGRLSQHNSQQIKTDLNLLKVKTARVS
jgi:hypothetical protein